MASIKNPSDTLHPPPPAPLSADRLVGRVFNNRFRIHSLIARGGMGKVYRAVQVPLNRVVALKVLHPTFTGEQSADFHRRFFLEAAIAAQLTHPHVVTVFDFGQTDDGIYYLAMEFLQGHSLRQALHEARVFAPHRALHVVTQIAGALRDAHALGAIHRDLKPANIYLLQRGDERDFVKVLDFGLVKSMVANDDDAELTQPGKFMGSPGYMAPEQIRGRAVDARCDIYALGVLLYEMLTGRPPFVCSNAMETMMAHVHDPVPPLQIANPHIQVPPQLEQVVQTCLTKDPAGRYPTMDALLTALTELLGGDAPVTLVSQPPRFPAPTRTRLPMRLDDEEKSGWSVVSTTGVLARPRAPRSDAPTCEWAQMSEDAAADIDTVLGETLALDAAPPALAAALRPAPPPPPPPLRPRQPSSGGARWRVALALSSVAAMAAGIFAVTAHRARHVPVVVSLTSSPPGARAYVEGRQVCAATPCDVVVRDRGKKGAYVVHFRLDGFDEFVASRRLVPPQLAVHARLYAAPRPLYPNPESR